MTPTLQQAIKLLQMTRLELQDVVNQELVSNPVLEEQDPESPGTPDDDSGAAETRERELAETPGAGPGSADAGPEEAEGEPEPAAGRSRSAGSRTGRRGPIRNPAGRAWRHRPRGVFRRLHGLDRDSAPHERAGRGVLARESGRRAARPGSASHGTARLSGYVELIRNVPLLLQLLFWYNAVLKALPGFRQRLRASRRCSSSTTADFTCRGRSASTAGTSPA